MDLSSVSSLKTLVLIKLKVFKYLFTEKSKYWLDKLKCNDKLQTTVYHIPTNSVHSQYFIQFHAKHSRSDKMQHKMWSFNQHEQEK